MQDVSDPNATNSRQQNTARYLNNDFDAEADRVESVVEESKLNHHKRTGLIDLIHHWSWITIFAILGTLTRLGIQALNTYPGQLIPNLVWAQFIGCAVIGFLANDVTFFPKDKRYDAMYLGLTVGYCGSTTSFSAWILAVYEDLANTNGYDRPRGYNVISIITEVMVTLAASILAFKLGQHAALWAGSTLKPRPVPDLANLPAIAGLFVIALGFQVGAIITTGIRRDWRGVVGFAMVLSPAGALTRWYLSKWLNRKVPAFPMGTFAANMVGVLLEGIFHLLQYHSANGNSCSILQGLQDGYCGALTTVSTFVSELFALRLKHAYIYAATSIAIAGVLYVLVDGVDYWTHESGRGLSRCIFERP